jgi:glutamyl-tRNA synthetase
MNAPALAPQSGKVVRVRFAPSPTGYMHIGNLRTALFNWLFAQHNHGQFLLRIEDTDLERSRPEYTDAIFEAMEWVGMKSAETPVIQSSRIERHKEVAQRMIQTGHAYRCYCTQEELRARLGESAATGENYARYDERCRNLDPQVVLDKPYVIRFKIPETPEFTFNDLIHGPITFKREQLDDFIIVRSDGTPIYNFVVVVDDADMNITHIIRGEDHIPNTPKQILLYQAAGFDVPEFAHLPMILAANGNRLSKRDAVVSVLDYKKSGFLAEALCNYLVRLGWAHGDQEIFSQQELAQYFTLSEVGKKSSIFDIKKLEWMNGVYLRKATPEELVALIVRDVDPQFRDKTGALDDVALYAWIKLFSARANTLVELMNHVLEVQQQPTAEQLKPLQNVPQPVHAALLELADELKGIEAITADVAKQIIKNLCERNTIKLPDLAQPLRVILTGKTTSPGVFELLEVMGTDESLKRLDFAFTVINQA